MDKRFAIFDLDGTLVDSLDYWEMLPGEYLQAHGVSEFPPEISKKIMTMTVSQAAAALTQEFGLSDPPAQAAAEMNARMEDHYRQDVSLLPGRRTLLEQLREQGVRLCVASATASELVEGCLTRLGVAEYFSFFLSCEDVGVGKRHPDVYLEAARRLGAGPSETAVYEDAVYAAQTAKAAGFYVVGVEERHEDRRAMEAVADELLWSYQAFA